MTLVLFTDRDLGRKFPRRLREAGLTVEEHHDHFQHNSEDPEWLLGVGQRGWIALTHDKRIRYKPNECAAVMRAGLGLFVLVGNGHPALADNVINSVERLARFVERTPRPFIAKLYLPNQARLAVNPRAAGDIVLWLTRQQWEEGLV